MSPSIVTALKVSATPVLEQALQHASRAIGASVKTKDEHRRHVGRDHAGALGDAADGDGVPPSRAIAAAPLGKVSVVMIALAASCQAPGAASRDQLVHHAVEFRRIERLADHAGRGEKDVRRLAAGSLGGDLGGELGRLASGLAGEGIGIAGIDHQRARRAALELRAAPVDRRRGAFRAREHAGHGRAGIEQRQQHVGASGIADAGGGGRQPHAFDRRHVGKLRGRERGDGGWSWPALSRPGACPQHVAGASTSIARGQVRQAAARACRTAPMSPTRSA